MKTSKLWICGLVIFASLVNLPAAQAQRRGNMSGMMRRYQQVQQQQLKQAQAAQKAYMEWQQKVQAEAAAKKAAHIADMQRKKAEAEVERHARIEKNKQHNAELASHPKTQTRTSGKTADGAKFEKEQGSPAKSGGGKSEKGSDKTEALQDSESGEKETGEPAISGTAPAAPPKADGKKDATAQTGKPSKANAIVKK